MTLKSLTKQKTVKLLFLLNVITFSQVVYVYLQPFILFFVMFEMY